MRKTSVAILMVAMVLMLAPAARASDTEDLYEKKCKMCHGADGKGDTAAGKKLATRDFHSADVMKMTDTELTDAINNGKNKMPAYAAKLKPEQVKGLVAYIHELQKKK